MLNARRTCYVLQMIGQSPPEHWLGEVGPSGWIRASRDCGGFELGFKMGGDRGNGVSDEKFCFPIGDVTVEGAK